MTEPVRLEPVRLCRDCVYAVRPPRNPQYESLWRCLHPKSLETPEPSLVTGEQRASHPLDCATARNVNPAGCGKSGRYWSASPEGNAA
jgi:hypothetical protein